MSLSAKRAQELREKAISEAAQQALPVVLLAQGTASGVTEEKLAGAIRDCLDAALDPQYADQDFFVGFGVYVHVDRRASPWPSFEVLVPATGKFFYDFKELQ